MKIFGGDQAKAYYRTDYIYSFVNSRMAIIIAQMNSASSCRRY